jgi:hypothetical protein
MLEITDEGRAKVARLEFAIQIGVIMVIWKQDGESEEDIDNMVRLRIAIALIDGEVAVKRGPYTSKDEAREMAGFMIKQRPPVRSTLDSISYSFMAVSTLT